MRGTIRAGATRMGDFASTLRAAVTASGMTLGELVQELRRRDLSVSTATLSTWQTGRTTPARHRSVPVILELERLLDLPEGELLGRTTLPGEVPSGSRPPDLNPTGSALRDWAEEIRADWDLPDEFAFTPELLLTRVTVGDRTWRRYELEHHLRCLLDGADRHLVVLGRAPFSQDLDVPPLEAVSGCEIGRTAQAGEAGSALAVEMLLPRPMRHGELWRVAVRTTTAEQSPSDRLLVLSRPGALTVGQVVFDGQLPEVACRFTGRVEEGRVVQESGQDCMPLTGDSLTATLSPEEAGRAVELRWAWGPDSTFKT